MLVGVACEEEQCEANLKRLPASPYRVTDTKEDTWVMFETSCQRDYYFCSIQLFLFAIVEQEFNFLILKKQAKFECFAFTYNFTIAVTIFAGWFPSVNLCS